ncbi:odorant receptor 82a-like isoform X3 [Diachasmimorpha longicaudata]|uniref:odorant receptor 82a-like isoform X3 n=1 Tax=Diachasmimorpha longicaudata TaxID=58733 RepID=UPI0030B901D4
MGLPQVIFITSFWGCENSKTVRAMTSDFWDHPYYTPAKFCTSIVGQWPQQTRRKLILHRSLLFVMVILQITSRVLAVVINRDDSEVVVDALGPLIIDVVFAIKLGNSCYHFKKMKFLSRKIQENWNIFEPHNGLQQLHYHSNFGSFTTEPLQEQMIYSLLYPNITVAKRFPTPMYFGSLDLDTYYYPLFIASTFCTFLVMTVVGSCDVLLFMYAEHACGLFRGLGYAIENLPPQEENETSDLSFYYLRSCIVVHKRAIDFDRFAECIRDIYLWNFFGVIGLNMILMSVTGVQVVTNLDAMEKVVKYAVFVFMQMVHLFIECLAAQRLMDASFELKETLTNAKWYMASKKTHKLILLMLMRSQIPIVLSAGKMIVMNMDTYAIVLKTAASYFTVFLAMQ